MALKSDFEEVFNTWNNVSFSSKIVLLLSAILTIGSISNLADTVFQMKYFVIDGFGFYAKYISQPFTNLLCELYPNLPIEMGDASILALISAASHVGVNIAAGVDVDRFNKIIVKEMKFSIVMIVFTTILPILSPIKINLAQSFIVWWFCALIHQLYQYNNSPRHIKLLGMTYVLTPILLVPVVAAISSGLMRVR